MSSFVLEFLGNKELLCSSMSQTAVLMVLKIAVKQFCAKEPLTKERATLQNGSSSY